MVRLLGHSSVVLSAVIYRRWAVFGKRTFSVHLSSNCGNRRFPGRAFILVLLDLFICTTTTCVRGIGRRYRTGAKSGIPLLRSPEVLDRGVLVGMRRPGLHRTYALCGPCVNRTGLSALHALQAQLPAGWASDLIAWGHGPLHDDLFALSYDPVQLSRGQLRQVRFRDVHVWLSLFSSTVTLR